MLRMPGFDSDGEAMAAILLWEVSDEVMEAEKA